jgi:hypothetical protein
MLAKTAGGGEVNKKEFDFETAEKEALKVCGNCRYYKIRDDKHFCEKICLALSDIIYYSTGDNPAPPECEELLNKIDKNVQYWTGEAGQ